MRHFQENQNEVIPAKKKSMQLKNSIIVILLIITCFGAYVIIVNRNTQHMTGRQKILKAVYPAFMWFKRLTAKNAAILSNEKAVPSVSFYSLKSTLNDGKELDFASLKGK